MFCCMIRTWAALSTAYRWAGAACSPQPEHHPWRSSLTSPLDPPLPLPPCKAWAINTKFYTGIPRMQTGHPKLYLTANRPTGLWTSLCNPITEANASNLGTNAQPCHSSSWQPCYRSWALTKGFPSLKPSEQSQAHSSKLWVQVMEKEKVGNLAFQAQCLFSWTVCDVGWMRGITDLWVLIKR